MAYRLRADETIGVGVQRIAREQVVRALGELGDGSEGAHARAFAVRKRCKKVRALIALVRPAFEPHHAENAAFREISRGLGALRDSASLLEAFEWVAPTGSEIAERLTDVRTELVRRCTEGVCVDAEAALDAAREGLQSATERIESWSVGAEGFGALSHGLRRVYARSRLAMRTAEKDPTLEQMHEWRKRLKQDLAHTRLLRDVWAAHETGRGGDAARASELLGVEHDLGELVVVLQEASFGADAVRGLVSMIEDRRARTRTEALAIGELLYAQKPGRYTQEAERLWDFWRG